MKKNMKKIKLALKKSTNTDMIRNAYCEINDRTRAGACCLRGVKNSWDGTGFTDSTFFANPDELSKIKSEIENEFGVSINI